MSVRNISEELVAKTKEWLHPKGIIFFRKIKEKYGNINATWNEGGIPHCVHFREGMQIRNFMRSSGLCENWSDHDFDDNWILLIERCIK